MNSSENVTLPDLSDASIERIERGVFEEIAREKNADARRARTRRRWVGGSLGVAAVIVGAVLVVPLVSQPGEMGDSASSGFAEDMGAAEGVATDDDAGGDLAAPEEEALLGDRDIIRTGHARLVVDDVVAASGELEDLAKEHDGYVEAMGTSRGEGDEDVATEASSGWATLRVPAGDLDAVRDALTEIGEVANIEMSQVDVTAQTIDLEARIEANQASVDRLLDLMGQSGSVGELIEAESALAERQAELESLERQLEDLEDQVGMSTLDIQLTKAPSVEQADPNGFVDGLTAGWNGLVAALSGAIVIIGALIPWLGALGIGALIVWGIVRLRRRRG
ncbi:DUF4349 domain-containing protein [Microbacterium sp. G2-8]|uniref:DUF4349 domain-containing protein n=1 Tax=Microbacterium sp. G2-8 TaxID=2842454 RepID=UPI001C897363|nr:DUF4349 domain-containing protein [Microbacterium sp. G2-8]